MMKNAPKLSPLVLACLAAISASASQQALAEDTLSKVHVTTQDDQKEQLNQSTISAENIEKTIPQDMKDVFKNQVDVNVGGGVSNAQKIYLRGVEDTNVNIVIDGARQGSNLFHHQGNVIIDPDLLKQVEVDAGPGAADAGYGALGGSIQFTTKDAQDYLKPGETIGATVKGEYSSVDQAKAGSVSAYGMLSENFGLMAYGKLRSSDNYKIGGGDEQPYSAGDQKNYLLKGSLKQDKGNSLTISAQANTDEGNYPNRANFPWETNNGFKGPAEQKRTRNSYTLQHRYNGDSKLLDIKTNLYFNEKALEYTEIDKKLSSDTYSGDVRNVFGFDTFGIDHQLSVGLDYFKEKTKHVNPAKKIDSDEEASNLGVFVQDRASYGISRLSFGGRFDNYETRYAPGDKVSGDAFSPNATFEIDATDDLTFSLGYGESVRGANLMQASWIGHATNSPGYAPDFKVDNLKPERSKKWELGGLFDTNNLFTNGDQFTLSAKLYNNTIEDFVMYKTAKKAIQTLYNANGDVTSEGYEAMLAWKLQGLQTKLSYNHTKMRDENGDPIGDSMRKGAAMGDKLIFNTHYAFESVDVELGYTLTNVTKLTDVTDGDPEKPGYTTHDVTASWYPLKEDELSIQFAINNLTDAKYADHTTFFFQDYSTKEPGRDYRVAVSYRF